MGQNICVIFLRKTNKNDLKILSFNDKIKEVNSSMIVFFNVKIWFFVKINSTGKFSLVFSNFYFFFYF